MYAIVFRTYKKAQDVVSQTVLSLSLIRRERSKLFLLISVLLKITYIAKLCFLSVSSVKITTWKISAKRVKMFELF